MSRIDLGRITFFAMHLILSSGTPWNATYCDESGQVLYKAQSPFQFIGCTIQIFRHVIPPTLVGDTDLRAYYEHVAEINFYVFKDSRITYQGVSRSVTEIFRKHGSLFCRKDRIFTGPDGREYVWKLTTTVCKLFLNDSSKTPVATFHRKRLGIFSAKRPASLEIFPEGQHMVELIVVTFIYMDKLREDKERRRRSATNHNR